MTKNILNVPKIQKRSTETQAADMLREGIISGAIALGTRLTEINSSEQLGVSRSTIRTAFHQLVQEGLIVQTPYTGWSVMTLSAGDAWELYTLRASLEALAARLVTLKIQQEGTEGPTFSAIKASFDRLSSACQCGDQRTIAKADMALHKTIVEVTGHSRLMDQYARIQHQVSIYIQSSDALVSEGEEIMSQHLPLIEAIESKDADAAMQAAMQHNESEGAILVKHLEDVGAI